MRPIKLRCWNGEKFVNVAAYARWKRGILVGNYNVIFEQYTGLNDRNGNEIYEGDIIKRTYKDKTFCIFPVELSIYEDDEQYSTYEHCGWNYNGRSLVDTLNQIEVIGNIHSNPELLETKQC